jgi:hypothetical protein
VAVRRRRRRRRREKTAVGPAEAAIHKLQAAAGVADVRGRSSVIGVPARWRRQQSAGLSAHATDARQGIDSVTAHRPAGEGSDGRTGEGSDGRAGEGPRRRAGRRGGSDRHIGASAAAAGAVRRAERAGSRHRAAHAALIVGHSDGDAAATDAGLVAAACRRRRRRRRVRRSAGVSLSPSLPLYLSSLYLSFCLSLSGVLLRLFCTSSRLSLTLLALPSPSLPPSLFLRLPHAPGRRSRRGG